MSKTVKVYTESRTKVPGLKKYSDGLYTIEGYHAPKPTTPDDMKKIVKNLLAPIKIPSKG